MIEATQAGLAITRGAALRFGGRDTNARGAIATVRATRNAATIVSCRTSVGVADGVLANRDRRWAHALGLVVLTGEDSRRRQQQKTKYCHLWEQSQDLHLGFSRVRAHIEARFQCQGKRYFHLSRGFFSVEFVTFAPGFERCTG
jgi:hypothetical protein